MKRAGWLCRRPLFRLLRSVCYFGADKPQHPRTEKAAFARAQRNCSHENMYSPAWPSAHVVSILLGVSYGKMCLYVTKMHGVEVERDRKGLLSSLGGCKFMPCPMLPFLYTL